ncbi:Cryptochrome-2 [Orbilia brochopaga]|nr:Cryptochrome-2 [Drechslerella brochopaga]
MSSARCWLSFTTRIRRHVQAPTTITIHRSRSVLLNHHQHPTSLTSPQFFRTFSIMPPKAKATKVKTEPTDDAPATKRKAEPTDDAPAKKPNRGPSPAPIAPRYEPILREFYPPLVSDERVQFYREGKMPTPLDEVRIALRGTTSAREKIEPDKAIAHWFRWDLRLHDNTALHQAHEAAKAAGVPLVCLYVFSHQDHQAHCTSPARLDFTLRTLKVVKDDLAKLDIPLWVEEVKDRKQTVDAILNWCNKWGVSHMHANMLYEVDELRRDAKLIRAGIKRGLAFDVHHDTCVVKPGLLRSGSLKPYAIFTPYFKTWEPYVKQHKLLDNLSPPPEKNDAKLNTKKNFKELFDQTSFPKPAKDKLLPDKDAQRLAQVWPPGEHEAKARLEHFLNQGVVDYADLRDRPDIEGATSGLSPHFAAGTISARQACRATHDHNKGISLAAGHFSWIREICFRDFYKHILVVHPHVCMSKAYHVEYHNIVWEYNDEHFQRWTEGKTGYPIVDAAMRQLATNKALHNRCRMIVASFLCKDLLLDWRKGERYFMENLIDADFASNNAGWQFCSSSGTDAQPYFRIFNPLTQSEKYDPNGDYIRRWVPELKDVDGKAIHEPHSRLSEKEFKKLGYPEPIVEHKFARERALERYKSGLGKETRF